MGYVRLSPLQFTQCGAPRFDAKHPFRDREIDADLLKILEWTQLATFCAPAALISGPSVQPASKPWPICSFATAAENFSANSSCTPAHTCETKQHTQGAV